MAVVNESQLGSINQSVPQLIIVEVQPNPSVQAASTNVVGLVGQFQFDRIRSGEKKESYVRVGSLGEIERKFKAMTRHHQMTEYNCIIKLRRG